jgi:hypothetical protein
VSTDVQRSEVGQMQSRTHSRGDEGESNKPEFRGLTLIDEAEFNERQFVIGCLFVDGDWPAGGEGEAVGN